MKSVQSPTHSVAMHIHALMALPFKFLSHLFMTVIDLLINIPVMNAVWRERRELELLTKEHIKDIGLNSDHVRQEIKRNYFDIPHERKRSCKDLDAVRYCKSF